MGDVHVEELQACVCVGVYVKLCTVSLKAPLGRHDPLYEPSNPNPLKRKHTPTHTELGAPTIIHHVLQWNLQGLY